MLQAVDKYSYLTVYVTLDNAGVDGEMILK
jgi:hypothetical protein